METAVTTISTRDVALRAVGRNVVNFQKLEHCLKVLVRTDHLSAPLSTVEGKLAKRRSRSAGYTLGKAVQEWLRISEFGEKATATTQDLFEPWVSISFGPLIAAERLAEHSEALNALAVERNKLIHQELANCDFESDAACQNLVAGLDRQNARILEQLKFLAPAIKGLIELNKWTLTPEFQDELSNELMRHLSANEI
jgi:hypothetical protein